MLPNGGGVDTWTAAEEAAAALSRATGVARYDAAVVMGSGWLPAADLLGTPTADVAIQTLPGFTPPGVPGHPGRVRAVPIGDKQVLVMVGRTHLYEGRGTAAVAHGVRTAVAAGARAVMLTNAAGGLRADLRPGDAVVVSDHLNLTATSPIAGAHFVDLTDLYSPRLRALAAQLDPTLTEGVYAQLPGPHFETPAEIRMLRTLGADLVGMSTALEAIAARAVGAEVFALSLVTNLAAGLGPTGLDHQEVLETGQSAAGRLATLLADLIARA